MKKTLLIFTLLLALTTTAAQADSFGLGFAGSFNTFVFNDFTGTSDTEGRLAVGGNAELSGYSVGDKLSPGQYNDMLVVGGNLNYSSGRVYYGNAIVGGTATLGHANVADGNVYQNAAMPFSFASEQQRLTGLSSSLAQKATTGTVNNAWGGLTLTGNGGSGMQIFNLNGNDLLSAWGMSLNNVADDASVIINVSGLTAGLTGFNMESMAPNNDKVLFNFYEANSLLFSGVAVQGSILAPLADVADGSGVIWGTTVANSWNSGIQQNHVPFTGQTPIPAAVWLLGSGLLGLFGFRKARRS